MHSGATPSDCIVVVDKPTGVTSHDVVARMRRLVNTRKVGHGGTLDPMATGVLVIGVGRATRLLGYVSASDKSYDATIRLGQSTLTDDADGELLATKSATGIDQSDIQTQISLLTGSLKQTPSSVSAIKVDGKRAYKRVREGEAVILTPRTVIVASFVAGKIRRVGDELLDVDVSVVCSSGTYIRALARDLGQALGVGGHLTALRRTRVGAFSLEQARSLDQLSAELVVVSLADAAAACFPTWTVEREIATFIGHGRPQEIPDELTGNSPVAVLDETGALVALMEPRDGHLRVLVGFTG